MDIGSWRSKHAENHLEIAIELDSNDITAREMLGQLYLLNRQYKLAENQFLALSKIDLTNDNYLSILGDLAKLQKEWNKSIDFYVKAYQINPQNFKVLESAMQVCLSIELLKKLSKFVKC